jgi:hypothetical protein
MNIGLEYATTFLNESIKHADISICDTHVHILSDELMFTNDIIRVSSKTYTISNQNNS